jgi:hypothetical protein
MHIFTHFCYKFHFLKKKSNGRYWLVLATLAPSASYPTCPKVSLEGVSRKPWKNLSPNHRCCDEDVLTMYMLRISTMQPILHLKQYAGDVRAKNSQLMIENGSHLCSFVGDMTHHLLVLTHKRNISFPFILLPSFFCGIDFILFLHQNSS